MLRLGKFNFCHVISITSPRIKPIRIDFTSSEARLEPLSSCPLPKIIPLNPRIVRAAHNGPGPSLASPWEPGRASVCDEPALRGPAAPANLRRGGG
jgi:hypothetical protein